MNSLLIYNLGERVECFSTRIASELPYPVITGHHVHGTEIANIDRPGMTREELEGYDALITSLNGVAIGVRTADCVPILLYDPIGEAVAAVHSGWKGTLNRICQKTIFKMKLTYGTQPANLKTVIGPCICAESFQVGEEVVGYFKEQKFPMDEIWHFNKEMGESPMYRGHHIDLAKTNRMLLEELGVKPENIHFAGIDTYSDPSFFSARRDGTECGRIITAIKLVQKEKS